MMATVNSQVVQPQSRITTSSVRWFRVRVKCPLLTPLQTVTWILLCAAI